MAGHSQFKNIMFRKGAQDKKRARLFARLSREIQIAAQQGADPQHNSSLRVAINQARHENMPRDNIERAVKRGSGMVEGKKLEAITYEGYGPAGVALIIETLTNNRNRTSAQVRACLSKHNATLSEQNTVLYQFERCGEIVFHDQNPLNSDSLLELAIDAGAQDITWDKNTLTFEVEIGVLHKVAEYLAKHLSQPDRCELIWKQKISIPVQGNDVSILLKLINNLEDLEDVQTIFSNLEIADNTLEKLLDS